MCLRERKIPHWQTDRQVSTNEEQKQINELSKANQEQAQLIEELAARMEQLEALVAPQQK